MTSGLDQLNSLVPKQAEAEFLKCCGARKWALEMAKTRPFHSFENLLNEADRVFAQLDQEDWLEAFRAHPKIGEKKAAVAQTSQAQQWSAGEQSGIERAAEKTVEALAAANLEYERRFGFIFIVCATGKSSEEMLALLTERMQNDPETELKAAAEEQRKITHLRLEKLISE